MRVNSIIAKLILGAILAIQAWTLKEVIDAKVQIAVIREHLHIGAPGTVGELNREPMTISSRESGE